MQHQGQEEEQEADSAKGDEVQQEEQPEAEAEAEFEPESETEKKLKNLNPNLKEKKCQNHQTLKRLYTCRKMIRLSMNNHYCHGNILFVRVAIVSITTTIIITSLLPYTITTVSTHAQSQSQPFEHAVTGSGELGAGARLMDNYTIAAKVSNTTSPELLNYAYNQGLAMGRGEGPNGRGDSAPGAVCPSGVDLEGAFCKAWVIGYEDGFAQTCNSKAAAASGDTCPPKRRMHQPFHFIMTVCISDAGPLFLQGYYRAHVDFFNGQSYNQTLPMYNGTGNFYFDIRTGEKIPDDNVTGDYAAGYKIGWQDAKRVVFQVDC